MGGHSDNPQQLPEYLSCSQILKIRWCSNKTANAARFISFGGYLAIHSVIDPSSTLSQPWHQRKADVDAKPTPSLTLALYPLSGRLQDWILAIYDWPSTEITRDIHKIKLKTLDLIYKIWRQAFKIKKPASTLINTNIGESLTSIPSSRIHGILRQLVELNYNIEIVTIHNYPLKKRKKLSTFLTSAINISDVFNSPSITLQVFITLWGEKK